MKPLCFIGLCVYNNEEGLPRVLLNICKLCKLFQITVVVFYDESTDRSLEILESDEFKCLRINIIKNTHPKHPERTYRIAFARNVILEVIKRHGPGSDYFIMMDTNEYACVGDIDVGVIEETIARKDWDAISFDRAAGYYDIWALSVAPFVYSFMHFEGNVNVCAMMKSYIERLIVDYKQRYPSKLIPVQSAFNGFAIYRTSKFLNCSYISDIIDDVFPEGSIEAEEALIGAMTRPAKIIDCEHRHFHLEAIKKNDARIRISTKHAFAKVENPREGLRGPC